MKHEERLKKFYEYMDSPEGKLSLENHFKELEEEHKKILDFFESEEFNMILNKFNNSPIDEVNSHEWMYHGSYDFIKEDEFYNLFYSIWKTRHEEIKEDEESIFSSEYLDYKGYRLRQTNGQGTIAVMTKL